MLCRKTTCDLCVADGQRGEFREGVNTAPAGRQHTCMHATSEHFCIHKADYHMMPVVCAVRLGSGKCGVKAHR